MVFYFCNPKKLSEEGPQKMVVCVNNMLMINTTMTMLKMTMDKDDDDEDDKEDENDADHQVGASDKAGPDRRAHSSGEQGTHH